MEDKEKIEQEAIDIEKEFEDNNEKTDNESNLTSDAGLSNLAESNNTESTKSTSLNMEVKSMKSCPDVFYWLIFKEC